MGTHRVLVGNENLRMLKGKQKLGKENILPDAINLLKVCELQTQYNILHVDALYCTSMKTYMGSKKMNYRWGLNCIYNDLFI